MTPTQQIARLKGTDHTEQLYKLAMEQAEELERVQKDLDDACAVIACKDHQRDDLKWQVEELMELCKASPMKLLEQARQLRAENTMLKAQNDSLDRELTRRDSENAELRASYQDALSEIATLKYLDDEAKVGADEVSRQRDQWKQCAEELAACLSLHAKFYKFNPDDNTALAKFNQLKCNQ